MEYLLILLSVLLLALGFILQKLYQRGSPQTTLGGVDFSILSACFSLILLLAMSGFTPAFSWYSAINALLRAACGLAYTVIGFWIMKRGHMALYMLFLMSGGMVLPAVWGWLFLKEEILPLRVLGVAVILVSIALTNRGGKRPDLKMLLCCLAVFVLNGFVSVFSKLHQVENVFPIVNTECYALYGTLASLLMSICLRFILARGGKSDNAAPTEKKPPIKILIPILIVAVYSVLGSVSSLLQLWGAANLPASLLYPMITGGSIVFTSLFACIFFGERPTRSEWVGIALCFAGTLLFL
jgi:drug/metabolite transporter (DMT)-like permease